MKKKTTIMLALFGRGREIGYVLLEDGEIVRYGIKSIKGKRRGTKFERKVKKAVAMLLQNLNSDEVNRCAVMERISHDSKRGALCKVMDKIARGYIKGRYPVRFISLEHVKSYLCGNKKATFRELIETVAERYPILLPLATIQKPTKARYWQKVLIAMALAEAAKRRRERH